MNSMTLKKLNETAEEFGAIARRVNESSKKRKDHSQQAINLIERSLELGARLDRDFTLIAQLNVKLRDQDTFVQNTCLNLKSNIEQQRSLINTLADKNAFSAEVRKKIQAIIDDFSRANDDAIQNIGQIISVDNDIVFLDKVLITRKEVQQESLKKLQKLSTISLDDAEKAIHGSSSNLERGLAMVERFKKADQHLARGDKKTIEELAAQAAKGWGIAEEVNKSSRSQLSSRLRSCSSPANCMTTPRPLWTL